MRRIALYGGSFNPPTCMHRELARELTNRFDLVLVVPCGPRPDKESTNAILPGHRARMVELAFDSLANVDLDLFDLNSTVFSRAWQLEDRFRERGEIWHVVGAELCKGGALARSPIQREWDRGNWLWENARFAVSTRAGHPIEAADLPPHAELIYFQYAGSSSDARERMGKNISVAKSLPPQVEAYISAYGLYEPQTEGGE